MQWIISSGRFAVMCRLPRFANRNVPHMRHIRATVFLLCPSFHSYCGNGFRIIARRFIEVNAASNNHVAFTAWHFAMRIHQTIGVSHFGICLAFVASHDLPSCRHGKAEEFLQVLTEDFKSSYRFLWNITLLRSSKV